MSARPPGAPTDRKGAYMPHVHPELHWTFCSEPERPVDEWASFHLDCRACALKVGAEYRQPNSYWHQWQYEDLIGWCTP